MVATVGRNAWEGKWGLECSWKGLWKGDGTSPGYLDNSGMVVLYIKLLFDYILDLVNGY